MIAMSLNMAYPWWNAPLPNILSKRSVECQARTRGDLHDDISLASRSIFLRSRLRLVQRILQKSDVSITENLRAVAK